MARGSRETGPGRPEPIVISATLEGMYDRLRLSILLSDGLRLEERGMSVGNSAEANREVTSFAASYPGIPIERLGDGWTFAGPASA